MDVKPGNTTYNKNKYNINADPILFFLEVVCKNNMIKKSRSIKKSKLNNKLNVWKESIPSPILILLKIFFVHRLSNFKIFISNMKTN